MTDDPHEWHLASDKDGWFIENEYGEEINPPWLEFPAQWRCQTYHVAMNALHETIQHFLEYYEPGRIVASPKR